MTQPPDSPIRRGPRVEMKFRMLQSQTDEIFQWAQERMPPDPYVLDPRSPTYLVESIYFDTPRLDCLRERGADSMPKYRVRRYNGDQSQLYLEEKLRRRQLVWKRRLACSADEVAAIAVGTAGLSGDAEWFRVRFRVLRLEPKLTVVYRRWALCGESGERLTIDRCIEAYRPADVVTFHNGDGRLQITTTDVLEIKHTGPETPLIRELLALAGRPDGCSKYGSGMRAFGFGRSSKNTDASA